MGSTTGGGEVFFSPGRYAVTGLTAGSQVTSAVVLPRLLAHLCAVRQSVASNKTTV